MFFLLFAGWFFKKSGRLMVFWGKKGVGKKQNKHAVVVVVAAGVVQ